jgi:hypothetical protein
VAEKKSKTGKHQNVIWTVVSMKSLRREFDETSVKGKLNSAMWPVSDVRSSFPLERLCRNWWNVQSKPVQSIAERTIGLGVIV